MIALAGAVALPIIILQTCKIFAGPLDFGLQLGVVLITSIITGLALYFTHRSSAQNEP